MTRLERAAETSRRRGKAKPQMIAITETCAYPHHDHEDYDDDNDDNNDDADDGNNGDGGDDDDTFESIGSRTLQALPTSLLSTCCQSKHFQGNCLRENCFLLLQMLIDHT